LAKEYFEVVVIGGKRDQALNYRDAAPTLAVEERERKVLIGRPDARIA
jgi:hypothetical protein